MTVHKYEVAGEFGDPGNFQDYLFSQLRQSAYLELQATEYHNEPQAKRTNELRQFKFRVREVHCDIGSVIAIDVVNGTQVHIQFGDSERKVRFFTVN